MDISTKERLLKKAGSYQNKSQGATAADLMEVCKAMRDHVRETLAATEGEIGLRLGKAIEQRFDKSFGEALHKSVEGYLSKRLENLQEAHNERVEFLRQSYEEGMRRVERLIGNLQIPQPVVQFTMPELILPPASVTVSPAEVVLPAPAIVVNVAEQTLPAPVAQFVLPEINLPAPIVNVAAAEVNLPAPVVNVAAAEVKSLPAPIVNVSMPRRKMIKRIEYDAHNRPATIEETEVEVPNAD